MPPPRSAKTLVELLVVAAVVAVVVGLLLAAVQKVRTRAARLRDEHNGRQVALAAHGYQAQHGRLPPLTGQPKLPPGQDPKEIPVAAYLLPLLDQPPAEVLWDVNTPNSLGLPNTSAFGVQVVPAYTSDLDPSHSGGRVYSTDVPTGVGNWAFNVQVFGPRYRPCWTVDGKASLASTFPDGTSNTLLLATKRGSCGSLKSQVDGGWGGSIWWSYGLAGHCDRDSVRRTPKTNGAFFGMVPPPAGGTGPTFQVLPSQDDCDPEQPQGFTAGVITVALADGSVRTVRAGIDPKLWRAGLLPADGAGLPADRPRYHASMTLDPATAAPPDVYAALTGVVNPRPIAWVLTKSPAGVLNLAPFSFFNVFGSNPPVLVFSPTLTRAGKEKDTLMNVRAAGECVVHVATADLREQCNLSSKELPPDRSEVELVGLHTVPSVKITTPRLAESPVALECMLRQVVEVGDGPSSGRLVVCEVVMLHVADAVLGADGRVDPRLLRTVGRMGGDDWVHTTDRFKLPRP